MCIFYFCPSLLANPAGTGASGLVELNIGNNPMMSALFSSPPPTPFSMAEVMAEVWMSCLGQRADKKNEIGDKGSKVLAEALKANSSIEVLDLECEYGGRGGEGSRG
jgi:hypothetical protein